MNGDVKQRERPRCTGAAIEAGLHIAELVQQQAARAASGAAAGPVAVAAVPSSQEGMSRTAMPPQDMRMLVITCGPTTKASSSQK